MTARNILILGASSDIGVALEKEFTRRGDNVILAARRHATPSPHHDVATSPPHHVTTSPRPNVTTSQRHHVPFDALNFEEHFSWFNSLPQVPDITICLFGYLGDQRTAEKDWKEAKTIIDSNYTGAVSILNVVAAKYRLLGKGMIVGFSSVAGERGRQSNYIYGSAKAGLTAYLSGLRNSLYPSGVHVMTVKPGFMYTKMTQGLKLPPSVTAKPDDVAKKVVGAINGKKNVVYVMGIWRLIMFVIRSVPEFIFKRLKL
jgi:decaprenylphospho-beta-D-erythro-pentofuranosid-2-ulose 2-reductase